ncbi:MAG: hypothetical protein EAX81_01955 [Candidatus Thorarchaeota archaeon]|nr:hypothetical protein [Candidatus Thorarchaeota archaeon]
MEQVVIPSWLRTIDILVGALSIALCGFVLLGLLPSSIAILILLTIALFMVGLARFARAAAVKAKGIYRRVVNLIAGSIGIGAAALVAFDVELPEGILLLILGIAWMIMGIARILIGALEKDVAMWARILQIVVGLATITLTSIVILITPPEFSAVVLFLSIAVIVNGFARASRGYVGI